MSASGLAKAEREESMMDEAKKLLRVMCVYDGKVTLVEKYYDKDHAMHDARLRRERAQRLGIKTRYSVFGL